MDNPPDDGPCEVTITAPDRQWLERFVRQLVQDRIAAAAHVDEMHTTYRWAGEVHEATEARAVLHTVLCNVPYITRRTRNEHQYEVACVVATRIAAGDDQYLSWIADSVDQEIVS